MAGYDTSYLLNRLFQAVFTIVGVIVATFTLIRLPPGGPAEALRTQLRRNNPNLNQERIDNLVQLYIGFEPDKPLHLQFMEYFSKLLHGNMGQSLRYDEAVVDILATALPWTIFVMSISIILSSVFSILLGALMAYKEGSRFDITMTSWSVIVSSIPYYVFALLFIYLLGYQWEIFPTGGRLPTGVDIGLTPAFLGGALYHAALPIASLVIPGLIGGLSMRGNAIQVLGEDFMRVARLRGLSDNILVFRYTLRNAVLPIYTQFIISIGFMFGGSVILEMIFAYPGMGYYLLQSIDAKDYSLMMGAFLIITITVILSILVADLTYGLIDPRANVGSQESYTSGSRKGMSSIKKVIKNPRLVIQSLFGNGNQTSNSQYARDRDGGIDEDSVFADTSDTITSRRDIVYHYIDLWILTPFRIIQSDIRTQVGFLILAIYLLMGTVGVVLVPEAKIGQAPILAGPFENMNYILGTDGSGRPIAPQLIHATPPMLKMIAAGAVFATTVGTVVGTVAGYAGGTLDTILSTITDMVMAIPGLPLIIVLTAIWQPESPFIVGFFLTVNAWAGLARSVRSQILTIREESYVEAARAIGAPTRQIISDDILPNIMPYVLVNFANTGRSVIFSSVGLYFLGVLPFSTENWGVMLNFAYSQGGSLYTLQTAHWFIWPMLTIIGISLSFILIAQGMDRLFNPRVRARHSEEIAGGEGGEDEDDVGPSAGMVPQ